VKKYCLTFFCERVKLVGFKFTAIILLSLALFDTAIGGVPQNSLLNDGVDSFMNELYSFDFVAADSVKKNAFKKAGVEYKVSNLLDLWWNGLTYPGYNSFFVSLENEVEKNVLEYESSNKYNNDILYTISCVFGIRLAAIKGEEMLMLRYFLKIRAGLSDILETPMKSQENMLVAGIYNYTIAGLKEKNSTIWPIVLIFYKAESEVGRSLLKKCAESSSSVISTEAHYFLFKIEDEIYNNKDEALSNVCWLINKYPNNIVFRFEHLRILNDFGDKGFGIRNSLSKQIMDSSLTELQKHHFLSKI